MQSTPASTLVSRRAVRMLATILAMSTLMLVSPFLIRVLERIVDQAILARPNYIHASRKLELALRQASQPQQLIDAALESVRATLHVDARWDEPSRRIEVSVSHQARTLMQQERAFLDSVQMQLDHRLDAILGTQQHRRRSSGQGQEPDGDNRGERRCADGHWRAEPRPVGAVVISAITARSKD